MSVYILPSLNLLIYILLSLLKFVSFIVALILVDSIMALFRVDYSGRGELADRQQKLNKMLSSLTKMSEQYNVAVVITNQVMCALFTRNNLYYLPYPPEIRMFLFMHLACFLDYSPLLLFI